MRALGIAVVALLCAAPTGASGKAYVVASDQPAFAEAARAALDALGMDAELLRADEAARALLGDANVIVAVGPLADRLVGTSAGKNTHVVECLTPKVTAARALAVPLKAASSEVLTLMHTVLPAVKRVAAFPSATSSRTELEDAAKDAGLQIIFPNSDEAFAVAVDRLVGAADLVWIEDAAAVPTGGSALVVKKATDARKQVVGPNRATVMQGAIFALVPDPSAHGRAAGETALRLMQGEDVRGIPPPTGRLVLNGALVRNLGLKLPTALLRRSETVE